MKVYERLRVVLTCIIDDHGGNETVEKERGKLFRDISVPDAEPEVEEEAEPVAAEGTNLLEEMDLEDDDDDLDA